MEKIHYLLRWMKCFNLETHSFIFIINKLCNENINCMSGNYVTHETFLVSISNTNKIDQTLLLPWFLMSSYNAWCKEAACCRCFFCPKIKHNKFNQHLPVKLSSLQSVIGNGFQNLKKNRKLANKISFILLHAVC